MHPSLHNRHLGAYFLAHPQDLNKMIFIAGPRQVGKTTLLESLGPKLGFKSITSLNWDRPADRPHVRDIHYDFFREKIADTRGKPLIIFDELHKYPRWKSFLKGYYDTFHNDLATIVTGSARLDVYRRGGDSLMGRYWLFHLYPFSVSELAGNMNPLPPEELSKPAFKCPFSIYESLLRWGGFPEPCLGQSDVLARRWKRSRRERLIREDLRDLSRIQDLDHVENLMDLVIASVGSTLSVDSLRESMQVSYNAVRTWLAWLEALYYCFRVTPYSKRIARGLKKEAKYFLYDWSEIEDPGARFENMVAMHLKKSVDFWNDSGAGNFDLHYVRDQQKREVDFLVLREKNPWMLIECKLKAHEIPSSLEYMTTRLKPTFNVLVSNTPETGRYKVNRGIRYWLTGAHEFLQNWV